MSDRSRILARLRAVEIEPAELPVPEPRSGSDAIGDPWGRFESVLEAVGGESARLADAAALGEWVRQRSAQLGAARVCCELPDLGVANVEPTGSPARDFADLDLCVVGGDLAVAENAAVWVGGGRVRDRAALFLAEHVVLVVDRGSIVDDMHRAYARIDIAADGFGVFVSGPSKTADIEQSLVIGAHGPRSLCVVSVG